MSTPYGKRGFFYEECVNGGPQWQRFTTRATDCPRISGEFLERERTSLGDRWFRQEYLCEFTDTGAAVFDADLVERAFSKDVKPLFA